MEEKALQKKRLKQIGNGAFLILVFAITLWTVFRGEDLYEMLGYLKSADDRYILLGVGCVLLFIIGESVNIYYLIKTLGERVRFSRCCLYSFIGFFYSCITPSASGGQPMQVVAMRKDHIPVAVSTVVLAIVTITYKLVLVLVGAAVLLFRPPRLMVHLEGVETIIYLGLLLNGVFIILLLMLVFDPNLVKHIAEKVLLFLHRIRPFRDFERKRKWMERITGQYHGTAEFYKSHKVVIVNVFMITLLQRGMLFLVTWFTYRAFHLSGESLPVIVLLQAMIALAADMLPLPGGMGISENLFLMMFETVFGEKLVLAGVVISRGISYYTQLLISAVMTAAGALMIKGTQEKEGEKI